MSGGQRLGCSHHASEKMSKRILGSGLDTSHIFKEEEGGIDVIASPRESQGKLSARVVERLAEAGHGVALARRTADHDVALPAILRPVERLHVADVRHMGPVMRQNRRSKWINLGKAHRLPSERLPRHARGFDAGKQ